MSFELPGLDGQGSCPLGDRAQGGLGDLDWVIQVARVGPEAETGLDAGRGGTSGEMRP